MRLNSYNMAVKVLDAKGCFADFVDRMWAYMEEGDVDKAQCAREKALGMLALITTASRWRPTIKNGKRYTVVFGTGAITAPVIFSRFAYNGVPIINSGILFGSDQDVTEAFAELFNHHIQEDDLISFRRARITSAPYNGALGILTVADELLPLVTSEIVTVGFAGSDAEFISEEVLEDEDYLCLTDEQILSVIEKIDELCECNC